MPQSRQLAAIMFTDIVGYTTLMGDDERKAFDLLRKSRQLQKPIIKKFNGVWIKELGDGVLASFPTVTDAVLCAREIQNACAGIADLKLRIGIHHGEVVFEDNDVFGDGVNIASRLQALAPIGGIWISESVYKNVANKKDIKTKFIRKEVLKNVKEAVRIYEVITDNSLTAQSRNFAIPSSPGRIYDSVSNNKISLRTKWIVASLVVILLITTTIFVFIHFKNERGFTGKEKSIAVLPFINIGNDPNQDYLSDGVTGEIITQLSKIADLKVISRSTAMLYKNSHKPVRQIAEEMGVASILEGSFQKSGDEIRITAQLIDANTQEHIWAEHYDHRNLNDILSIESEVAQRIAHELNARLSKEEKINIETNPTDNPEAYDLFLKGRYALSNSTLEGYHSAETFFQEAIKKDPKFRLAYSYLANTYISSTVVMGDLPPSTGARKAMNVLSNSLQEDTLYIDFSTLANIEILVNKNFAKGEYYLNRAIKLNPNDESSYIVYAVLLTVLGRTDDAFVQLDKSKTISPVNSFEFATRGEAYYASGRYDEAIKTFKEAIQVFPQVDILYDDLGRVYVTTQKYPDALSILTEALTHSTTRPPSTLAFMAIANFKMNHTKKSNELIQELKQRANRGEKGINIFIAIYYSSVNNKEEAFNYLDQALNTNDVDLIWLKQEPSFNNLHDDARFNSYLKQVGF